MIRRRDFLGGASLAVAGGTFLSPLELLAKAEAGDIPYPPALTGMRGSHKGSFEVAHSVAWEGKDWGRPKDQTDDIYDLIVVGGGISGLTAAYLFQKEHGGNARVLILENHDDFGGHAKRNEFDVDGKKLIGYGGSQTIQNPAQYSHGAKALLKELAIETDRFYDYYDQTFYKSHDLDSGMYMDAAKYGSHALVKYPFFASGETSAQRDDIINSLPISAEAKAAFLQLMAEKRDMYPHLSDDETRTKLRSISYTNYLRSVLHMPVEVVRILRDVSRDLWGVGYDALSAFNAAGSSMPGMAAYSHLQNEEYDEESEPYIFHFPDGNAGIARMLVRKLLPEAATGSTMEDVVLTKYNYTELDKAASPTRIRLNATAVNVRHATNDKFVDVTYVKDGKTARVRGKHVIMACYNNILPHICPEMPENQRQALGYAKKIPLVYTNIAIKNWRCFTDAGFDNIYVPESDMHGYYSLDFPVSMGGYRFSPSPDSPIVVHASYIPTAPDTGLNTREQHEAGRYHLYSLTYQDFEASIFSQMDGMFAPFGFDVERDIAAITVNRWPHGYAYEYNDFSDPLNWGPDKGPHIAGRAQMGRISIANSDASSYAYVDGAIDAAIRAVKEQLNT